MKTTVHTGLSAFLCMLSVTMTTAKDLALTENEDYESHNPTNTWYVSSEMKSKLEKIEDDRPKSNSNTSTNLTLSSRPNYGITFNGNEIIADNEEANLNIASLKNELLEGDKTLVASGNIVLEEDIYIELPEEETLTIKSGQDIVLDYGVELHSLSQPLHLVFWSDSDGDESGGVLFDEESSLETKGGHLWVGGGVQHSNWNNLVVGNSYAVGLEAKAENAQYSYAGINLVGSQINSGAGDIYLNGKSTQTDYRDGIGVRVLNMDLYGNDIEIKGIGSQNANTEGNTNRGNWGVGFENTMITVWNGLQVYGEGGGQLAGENGGLNYGVLFDNNSSVIALEDANVEFFGKGGGNPNFVNNRDNDGLRINGGLIQINRGSLYLKGIPGHHISSAGMDQNGGTIESKSSTGERSTGTFVLEFDQFEVASSVRYKSTGDLYIIPKTPSKSIDLGGFQGDLQLTQRLLETNFENGFSRVIIGSSQQTGNINVSLPTFNHSVELHTSGEIAFNNTLSTVGGSHITLVNDDLHFDNQTDFNIDGRFEYRPFSNEIDHTISFPIPNLSLSSNGIVLGRENSQVDIQLTQPLVTYSDLILEGEHIYINDFLEARGNANLYFRGLTVLNSTSEISSESNISHRGDIIFKSDSSGSAVLGQVKGEFISENGNAIVEKYYAPNRAFRFLSSPVDANETIFSSIQNGGIYQEGVGTHITGSKTGENGFDPSASGNPSMFKFDSAEQWKPIENTDQTFLEAGIPYRLFIRGDRGIDLNNNLSQPNETRIIIQGDLKFGDLTYQPSTFRAGFKNYSFLGNPFQSKIDIKALLSNSPSLNPNYYYVWDPEINENGGYVVVDMEDGKNMQGSTTAETYVNPGEAFFVESLIAKPAITFTEDIKCSICDSQVSSSESIQNKSTLIVQLMSQEEIIDGIKFKFQENENNLIDLKDALKMKSGSENFSIVNGEELLSIESRDLPLNHERIELNLNNLSPQNYNLMFSLSNLNGTDVILHDKYLEENYIMRQDEIHQFTVDPSLPLSIDPNRFEIVFSNETLSDFSFDTQGLSLYPNPAKDKVQITSPWEGEQLSLEVFTTLGQLVYTAQLESDALSFDTGGLQKGVYIVKISRGKENYTTKMIKQ